MRVQSWERVLGLLGCVLLLGSLGVGQEQVTEKYPDGGVRRVFSVDAEGRKDGKFESFFPGGETKVSAVYAKGKRHGAWHEFARGGHKVVFKTFREDVLNGSYRSFHANGKREIATSYRDGQLHGRYQKFSADLSWSLDANYKAGKLDGKVTIKRDRKVVSKQKWKAGEIVELDGFRPFSRSGKTVTKTVALILDPAAKSSPKKAKRRKKRRGKRKRGTEAATAKADPQAAVRTAALRRLQAYRYLCGLRYEDLELVPEWNNLCDAAAEVFAANGQISHTPTRPAGFDAERYAQGARGASKSCISGGGGMVQSVDSYMNDSDARNIVKLGHRRWLVNPAMKLVGIGGSEQYSALWSVDASGSTPRGMEAVFYPPRGIVPVDFFGPRHAWSISVMRGPAPKAGSLQVTVQELDEFYQPIGKVLPMDHLAIASGGYGAGKCVAFRPVGLQVRPGKTYLVRVSFDKGKTDRFRYVVKFSKTAGG